jgi:FKBP-type peptidyl-prolyl cis-trans isomerase
MRLGMVIPGWNEGLQLMKPGAIYRFVIPPQLAYGAKGAPPKIAPNTTLVFYVQLVKVL